MSSLDLAAVRARYEAAKGAPLDGLRGDRVRWESSRDIPALIEEVERLTALLAVPTPRKPVCETCGDSIIYVPKSGFGNTGEWRHLQPPRIGVANHVPAVKVFVS